MTGARRIAVAPADSQIRLDRWFRRHFPGLGHARLEKLLRTGQVRLDGGRVKASDRVAAGQMVRVPPGVIEDPPAARPVSAADAAFVRALVLYRDREVIAIDKPSGLAVQGGAGIGVSVDSLLEALRFESGERPRLVHRLDRATSGVLVLARSRRAASDLAAAFREGAVRKEYWALAAGVPRPARGVVDMALAKRPDGAGGERVTGDAEGGRAARTVYRVVDRARNVVSWLALSPLTGRTHQLRVHCRALGAPILGDRRYGVADLPRDGRPAVRRLMLHARSIRIPRPRGRPLAVTAPLDAEMRAHWSFYGFDPEQGGGDGP